MVMSSNFPKPMWPGIQKFMETTRDFTLPDLEYWNNKKKAQRDALNGTETRMTIGHGETIAVISCSKGLLYYVGIPREYL